MHNNDIYIYKCMSYLNNSPIWLSDKVPVSLSEATQVEGVDGHMGAGLSPCLRSLLSRVFTCCCRACQAVLRHPDVFVDNHLNGNQCDGREKEEFT